MFVFFRLLSLNRVSSPSFAADRMSGTNNQKDEKSGVVSHAYTCFDAALLAEHPLSRAASSTPVAVPLSMVERNVWQTQVRKRFISSSPVFTANSPPLAPSPSLKPLTSSSPSSSPNAPLPRSIFSSSSPSTNASTLSLPPAYTLSAPKDPMPLVFVSEAKDAYEQYIRPFLSAQCLLIGVEELMTGTAQEFFRTAIDGTPLAHIFPILPPAGSAPPAAAAAPAPAPAAAAPAPKLPPNCLSPLGAFLVHLNARYCSTAYAWTKQSLLQKGFAYVGWWVAPQWATSDWKKKCEALTAANVGPTHVPVEIDKIRCIGTLPKPPNYLNTFRDCTTADHLILLECIYEQVWAHAACHALFVGC